MDGEGGGGGMASWCEGSRIEGICRNSPTIGDIML